MSFADQIKKFSDNAKNEIEKKKKEVENNARNRLQELLLAEEMREIKSITLDADIGKFFDVDAPATVLKKLRKADLLKN